MAQSALFKKLGRKEPTKGPARTLPPNARTDEVRTVRAFGVFWESWSAHVEKVSRGVLDARDDARADAKPPSRETLSLDFDRLFDQSGVERYLKGLTRKLADQNKGYIARVAKIPATQLATKDRTEGFIRENVGLIKTLGEEQIAEILPILRKASAAGQRFEDTAGAIRERTGAGWSHAKLIARDQTTKLNAQLLEDNATKAGIEEYDWSTSLDEAVREDHRKLHGKRFRFDSPPVVNKRTGERRNPGGDIQCRCAALPVVSLLEGI